MPRTVITSLVLILTIQAGPAAERFLKFEAPSAFLPKPRTVRIYLPPSYHVQTNRRYPVLYLHDGQNVFSFAGTNIAFGWGSWELDKTADRLSREGKMREIIMVGVDNSPSRMAEYGGRHRQADADPLTAYEKYAAFLTKELKPRIDSEYRTVREPAATGVMGSSMGGICSVILAWDKPDVFGLAASLSGAFQVDTNFLDHVLRSHQGKPKPVRLYLDSGVTDFMGGDDGCKLSAAVAEEFKRIGWGTNLLYYLDAKPLTAPELEKASLRRDKWAEAQTSQHNEFYWRLRAWRALEFLFPPAQ